MSLAPVPDRPADHRSGPSRALGRDESPASRAGGSHVHATRSRIVSRLGPEPLELCMLWLLDDAGPVTGLEAINRIAPLARHLDERPPSYPLLHRLEDAGCVTATDELPRRYEITDAGRQRASDLAVVWRPRLAERLARSVGLVSAHLAVDETMERRLFDT
jgi:DNA-binding PadR family transcriptional regulator